MNLKKWIGAACFFLSASIHAQNKKDVESIKSLCGCFEIEFKYAETFGGTDTGYKFSDPYHANGLEWVVPVESSANKFVFQHLLVVSDSMIIKHWREDWEYENPTVWKFENAALWKKATVAPADVKGKWRQSVWEVNDEPRYQGTATWIHADGKNYWENVADAPLPRREYTKRKDYNIMQRGNRIIITDTGWVHEQDNAKVVRTAGKADHTIAMEKGYNIYRKTNDSKCKQAQVWWDANKAYWNQVRLSWEQVLQSRNELALKSTVNGERLGKKLDDLQTSSKGATTLAPAIKAIIEGYAN